MSSSTESYLKRDFAAGVICLKPRTLPPPLTHCIQYTYSHGERWGGGGELNQREEEMGTMKQFTKLGRK
jgi:hypothetical protein